MDMNSIANHILGNQNFQKYVGKYYTDDQVRGFLESAGNNEEFVKFGENLFENIENNNGFKYADNGEDRYQSALDFATQMIGFHEENYAQYVSGEHKNGKIDLAELGITDEIFEKYGDYMAKWDLDGDVKTISAAEIASYMLALDKQGKEDGIISFDEMKDIDFDRLLKDSKENFNNFA